MTRHRARAWLAVFAVVAALFGGLAAVVATPLTALAATNPYQSPNTPDPSVAGATTPFTTYQAPEGTLGGGASVVSLTSAPTSEYDSAQGEATGHAYVALAGRGSPFSGPMTRASRSTSSTCARPSRTRPPAGA